ncbi:hypothetical protein JHK87_025002 [Glycine soja]|nr:hypothetical protein JHK87_025002 [Glycine soja]
MSVTCFCCIVQNEIRGQQPSSSALAHQLSLPNTSAEMTAIEKFLQLSDFVPSKIRAKRGCATHPRSIAEKSGGGLVEFAVAKKNILINATLGGVGHYALHRPIVN